MGLHLCIRNSHLYMSVVKSVPYFKAFKTRKQIKQDGSLPISVHGGVATLKMYQTGQRKVSVFLIVEKPG